MITNNPTYKTIKFTPSYQEEEIEVELEFGRYPGGQRYLQLWHKDEPYLTPTRRINVPGTPVFVLDDDDLVLRHTDNEELIEALIDVEIIDKPHAKLLCNYIILWVCQIK